MNQESDSAHYFPTRISLKQNILWIASIALIYFASARLSLSLVFEPEGIAAIWPPAGIFLSAILLTRRNIRPYLVGVLFITDFIAEMLTGTPLPVSLIYAFVLTADAVLSSWLLLRFVGEPIDFSRMRDVIGFLLLSVILSNVLWSLLSAAASGLLLGTPFWKSFQWWSASDGIGNLLVTPFILSWASLAKTGLRTWNQKRVIEGAALFIPLILMNHLVFQYLSAHGQFSLLLTYATFPYLLWASMRFGVRGVSIALLLVAGIAIYSTATGNVINVVLQDSQLDAVIVVQLYLAIMAIPSILIAVVVAERKRAEEKILKANRVYAVISQINQAIVRTRDKDKLFEETCRIAIEYGNFQMVWIGLVDEETKIVNPIIFAGAENGYFSKIVKISIRDVPEGRGPTGTAIREGRHFVCNDIANDSRMILWRDEALKRGYRSSIAFPIKYFGKVIGAFSLYAPISQFFDQEEIVLLDEVINDISFALESIETEKKQQKAEEDLRKSERRLSYIYDTVGDVIFYLAVEPNGNYRFISVNQAFCKVTGLSEEMVIGKLVKEVIPEPSLSIVLGKYRKAIEENSIIRWEEVSDYPTGQLVGDVSIAPVVDDKGRCTHLVGSVHDITGRKRAEEKMNYLAAIVQSSEDAIIGKNLDGIITSWNKGAEKIYGYAGCEVIGKPISLLIPPRNEDDLPKIMDKLRSGEYIEHYETVRRRKDGQEIQMSLAISPIRDNNGKIVAASTIGRDITERKQMEEQLRQMQKLEGLGTLAGGIAHDFNNILGIILAYITSIKRFKGDSKKLDLAAGTIAKAVERGKTLVQQILTFARKTETEFGAVDVNDIVMEIMTMIFETFPKILTYAQNFDKDVPFISADRSQLHQALLNLCVNARDAMPKGGVLTINTRTVSVANLRNQHPDAIASSYVCIEVIDTGEGMSEEIRKRIFEPFFTTKGIGKGTGLGLSVVFGVIQTHKGFIDVESELGKGTTFSLYLPTSQVAKPISEKEEETLEEIPGGTETLLVVEDEEMLLRPLQMVLVEKGYNVLSAREGLTALKIYQERKDDIALVLTDLGLPNMTGLEVCQRIKEINPNEHMILATGFLDPDMKLEFLKAGIQHFLYKPYDIKKVLKEVRKALDEK